MLGETLVQDGVSPQVHTPGPQRSGGSMFCPQAPHCPVCGLAELACKQAGPWYLEPQGSSRPDDAPAQHPSSTHQTG